MIKVSDQTLYQQRRHFHLADDRVAAPTQQTAHPARRVAVIHNQGTSGGVTEKTAAVLRLIHLVDLLRREPVLPLESGSKVFLTGGLRVGLPPLPKPLVPPLAVRQAVLAVASTRALAALTPAQPPIGERVVGEILGALLASGHTHIVSHDTNTQLLDQPCHADVLLELANPGWKP